MSLFCGTHHGIESIFVVAVAVVRAAAAVDAAVVQSVDLYRTVAVVVVAPAAVVAVLLAAVAVAILLTST